MVISYTWTRLHKILVNTDTFTTDPRTFCNQWMQNIVLRNPKPMPSWCDPFYVVFLPHIPESIQLMFTSTMFYFATKDTQPIGSCMSIFVWRQFRGRLAACLHVCNRYLPYSRRQTGRGLYWQQPVSVQLLWQSHSNTTLIPCTRVVLIQYVKNVIIKVKWKLIKSKFTVTVHINDLVYSIFLQCWLLLSVIWI